MNERKKKLFTLYYGQLSARSVHAICPCVNPFACTKQREQTERKNSAINRKMTNNNRRDCVYALFVQFFFFYFFHYLFCMCMLKADFGHISLGVPDFQTQPLYYFFFCCSAVCFQKKKKTFINLKQSIENIYPRTYSKIYNSFFANSCVCMLCVVVVVVVVAIVVGRFVSREFIIIIYFICQVLHTKLTEKKN